MKQPWVYMCTMSFIWNSKEPQLTKIILKKINKFEGLTSDDFNTYSEVTGIKRM